MKLNLLVLRTENPQRLKEQYEKLGLVFEYHKHGNGPYHYASESGEMVFEIYPLTKSMTCADPNVRLGFGVFNLNELISKLRGTDWVIKSDIHEAQWGIVAIVQDLDGRKIELKEIIK